MKSRIIGKKQLLIFTLVGALGLSVFINWYYSNPKQDIVEPELTEKNNLGEAQYVNSNLITDSNEFFDNANMNRTKAHDLAKENLNEIINNPNSSKETTDLAREKLFKISEQIKLEADIENIVKSQTNSQCLVTMSDNNIEVILPKESINESLIVKIKNIILSKTELSSEQISIIEI